MTICIFVSEIAKLTGRHPWTKTEEAIGQLLLRNEVSGVAKKRRIAEETHRRAALLAEQVKGTGSNAEKKEASDRVSRSRQQLSSARVDESRAISEHAVARIVECGVPDETARGIVTGGEKPDKTARAKIDKTTEAVIAGARCSLQQGATAAAVENASEELHSATARGDAQAVKQAVSKLGMEGTSTEASAISAAAVSAGIVQEDAALARVAAAAPGRSVSSKQVSLRRAMVTGAGNRYILYGKIDAILTHENGDKVIVETKQRQKRLFGVVPDYEMPQLLAYMYMARAPKAIQNEDYRGSRNEHEVEFDNLEWTAISEKLSEIVDQHFGTGDDRLR
jgi:hypothetical protein